MATTFNMLRANDLIWSFVVNNYLMGKDPFPFDLLFWNADATRMPAAMHSYYLRNMYQKNLLAQPGGLAIDNVPIDLAQDHDPGLPAGRQGRPHRARQVGLQGDAALLRAGALHAGGLGPYRRRRQSAARKKYQHWLNETAKNPPTLDEWQAGAPGVSRLVVERLGQVAVGEVRPQGAGARAGRRRPARDRGCAGQLREGADDRLIGRSSNAVGWGAPPCLPRHVNFRIFGNFRSGWPFSQSLREYLPTAIGPPKKTSRVSAGFRRCASSAGPVFPAVEVPTFALPPLLGGHDPAAVRARPPAAATIAPRLLEVDADELAIVDEVGRHATTAQERQVSVIIPA